MNIRLNVKISVSDLGKNVSVWSDEMKDLPGIEEYTGIGLDIPGAVSDYFDSLPETIFIEDDIVLKTAASAASATRTSSSRRDPNGPLKSFKSD